MHMLEIEEGMTTKSNWHVVRVDIVENFDTTPLYCDHCGKLLNGED